MSSAKSVSLPGKPILLDGLVRYGVSRNMPAEDEHGKDVLIALIVIERDNGRMERMCVREDLIKFAGEGIIEDEVRKWLASPRR